MFIRMALFLAVFIGIASYSSVSSAALMDIFVDDSVEISEVNVDAFGFAGDVNVLGSGNAEGGPGVPFANLDISLFLLVDPFLDGLFSIDDSATFTSVLFSDTFLDIAVAGDDDINGTDVIQILLGNPSGSAAPFFSDSFVVTLTGEFGSDPLGTGFSDIATQLVVNPVAAVPVAPSAWLLLAGMCWLLGARRGTTIRSASV